MAYTPFDNLKEKLLSTGIYKDNPSSAFLELQCYAAGFQALGDEIDNLLRESFVQTAVSYGLSEFEKAYDIGFVSDDLEERKKGLSAVSKIAAGSFTQKSIEDFLSEITDDYELTASYPDYTVNITIKNSGLSYYFTEWIKRILNKIITAELELSIVIDGLSWSKIEEKNLTWAEKKKKNYSWSEIDEI